MSHADLVKTREDLLRLQAMLRRRINAKATELDALERELDAVDQRIEETHEKA